MASFPKFSKTPIAIVTLKNADGVSAFHDEDPGSLAKAYVKRLAKRNLVGPSAEGPLAAEIAAIAKSHPRVFSIKLSSRLPATELMRALSKMPPAFADLFEDGESAAIESSRFYKIYTGLVRDPDLKGVFAPNPHVSGRKIRYGQITVPHGAGNLCSQMTAALKNDGTVAIHEPRADADIIHLLTTQKNVNLPFNSVARALGSAQSLAGPFALGATAMMISPITWTILRGLAPFYHFEMSVQTGNAVKAYRSGTKPLRKLRSLWTYAGEIHKGWERIDPETGFSDDPLIPFAPDKTVLAEIETYFTGCHPGTWENQYGGGIRKLIAECLRIKRPN